jgi:hypothetical protein
MEDVRYYLSIGVEIGIEPDSAVPCSHQAHPRRSEIYTGYVRNVPNKSTQNFEIHLVKRCTSFS